MQRTGPSAPSSIPLATAYANWHARHPGLVMIITMSVIALVLTLLILYIVGWVSVTMKSKGFRNTQWGDRPRIFTAEQRFDSAISNLGGARGRRVASNRTPKASFANIPSTNDPIHATAIRSEGAATTPLPGASPDEIGRGVFDLPSDL